MSLVSSFFGPMLTSVCLLAFGFEVYTDVKNEVWSLLAVLTGFQAVQSIAVFFVTFVAYKSSSGEKLES